MDRKQTQVKDTFIVIEDSSVAEGDAIMEKIPSTSKQTVIQPQPPRTETVAPLSGKKDSSHLALPNAETVREGKRWNRFLGPPSSFMDTEEAQRVRAVRNRALNHSVYTGSVIPYGYNGVKKEEKVVFPDGTIYFLSAFWMADPSITTNVTLETQTPLQMLPSRITDTATNTESSVSSPTITTATNTEMPFCRNVSESSTQKDEDIRIAVNDHADSRRDHHEEDDDDVRQFLSYFS